MNGWYLNSVPFTTAARKMEEETKHKKQGTDTKEKFKYYSKSRFQIMN